MLPDVNVLVAAHQAGHPHHRVAADWLQRTLQDANGQRLVLPMPLVSGFWRLVTYPRIFTQPSTSVEAFNLIDWLLESTQVRVLETAQEWPRLRQLVLEKQLSTKQIPDAWLAALSLQLSAPFVTFYKGFRRLLLLRLLVLLKG